MTERKNKQKEHCCDLLRVNPLLGGSTKKLGIEPVTLNEKQYSVTTQGNVLRLLDWKMSDCYLYSYINGYTVCMKSLLKIIQLECFYSLLTGTAVDGLVHVQRTAARSIRNIHNLHNSWKDAKMRSRRNFVHSTKYIIQHKWWFPIDTQSKEKASNKLLKTFLLSVLQLY